RVVLVSWLVAMTFAWGITAPLASFTVPVIWPVAVCAFDVPAMPSRKTSTAPDNATRLLGLMSSSPSRECSSRLAFQTTHPSRSHSVTLHRTERLQKLHILALLCCPPQLGSGYFSLEHFKRQELLSSFSSFTQRNLSIRSLAIV